MTALSAGATFQRVCGTHTDHPSPIPHLEDQVPDCFALTDDTAFALSRTTSDAVQEKNPTLRHLARTLAAAETYNSRAFKSLAAQFGVSVGAMAIRLEELGLLKA